MMMLTNYTDGGGGNGRSGQASSNSGKQQNGRIGSESPCCVNNSTNSRHQANNNGGAGATINQTNNNSFIVNSKTLSKALQLRTKAENLFKRQLIIQQPSKHHCVVAPNNDETRQDILKILYDYYSRIPLTNVLWNTSDVKQCLHDSMATLDYFDPYKAKQAFKLVASMLANLINWPWLKEYHRIYTYGGMFRSQILSQLCQDQCINIFRRVGYQLKRGILELTDFKCSQKSMDIVLSTIFDCLMAETICQDVIDVYENSRLCKSISASKQTIHVNFKSWIKFYYRQRLDLLSDCSAFNIHNKLNSISLITSLMSADNKSHLSLTNNNNNNNNINNRSGSLAASASPGTSKTSLKQPKSNSRFYVSNYLDDANDFSPIQRTASTNAKSATIHHTIKQDGAFVENRYHDHLSLNQANNVFDVPHNDKEPLINRRPSAYYNSRDMTDSRRNSIYDNVSPVEPTVLAHDRYDSGKTRSLGNLKAHNDDLLEHNSSSHLKTDCDSFLYPDSSLYPRLWSCRSCTYNNPSRTTTCEMCRANRYEQETKIKCRNCTLLNDSKLIACKACDSDLNSRNY